jgi:hypothetical protein
MARQSSDADGGDRAPFLKGGTTPMHSPTGTGTQKPGQSAQQGSSSIGSSQDVQPGPPGAGFYADASTNKDYAGTQSAGTSGPTKSGGNSKFAEGGKGSMFGNRGSLAARGGFTTPG